MISRSDDYLEYCRETARHARDLHDLALRGRDKKEITKRIHELIVEAVDLRPNDDLVDIGCGDGILLRMANQQGVRSALGLLATEEEVALARDTGLNVRQGLTDQLPVADESASVIVCNSVLLVVPREKIPASLREMYRIAKPEARIFIGEIPFEQCEDPTPHFTSRSQALSWMYRERGVRTWFGMLRRMVLWQLSGKPAIILPGTSISFFAAPQEFTALAQAAGLEVVRFWRHVDPDNRNNYLLRKPA